MFKEIKVSYEVKGEVRIHTTLSNGQHAAFYAMFNTIGKGTRIITVGFIIGKTRRTCNDWFNDKSKKLDNRSTGTCGMEGLMFAMACLQYIENAYCGAGDEIQVEYTDQRRKSAYRRLLKYGYQEGTTTACYYKAF